MINLQKQKFKRLETIANFISSEDILADIGCDHGYLAMFALKKDVKFIQLIDNKEGPLNVAKHNLEGYDNLEFTLASGLSKLNPQVDTISLCGMGGLLITELLKNDLEKAKNLKKIIIQANTDNYNLRKFLNQEKFVILDEAIIFENNKYYEIIVCKYLPKITSIYSEDELIFGPILLKNKTEIFLSKWENILKKYNNILKTLPVDNSQYEKLSTMTEKIKKIVTKKEGV